MALQDCGYVLGAMVTIHTIWVGTISLPIPWHQPSPWCSLLEEEGWDEACYSSDDSPSYCLLCLHACSLLQGAIILMYQRVFTAHSL